MLASRSVCPPKWGHATRLRSANNNPKGTAPESLDVGGRLGFRNGNCGIALAGGGGVSLSLLLSCGAYATPTIPQHTMAKTPGNLIWADKCQLALAKAPPLAREASGALRTMVRQSRAWGVQRYTRLVWLSDGLLSRPPLFQSCG